MRTVASSTYRDAWGIPHLRASDPSRLAFAQGKNAAHDRAWQIEVERHRSQGTTAAFLGADAVPWDRFARQARLDDTARRCFETLEEETATWVSAYVDGVDAGLERGAAHAPEFAATGLVPEPWQRWTPLGIWLARHILFAGFPAKLWREEVARRLGDEAVELFATDAPGTAGSNGWMVAGDRTATGAPLIAGDPHRFISDPASISRSSFRARTTTSSAFAVPGVPGIAHFGHSDLSSRGPSARYVRDLARRENSLWIVPLGARGIPGDAHHRDQLPRWLSGELVPVVTDFARLTEEPDDE